MNQVRFRLADVSFSHLFNCFHGDLLARDRRVGDLANLVDIPIFSKHTNQISHPLAVALICKVPHLPSSRQVGTA